MTLAAAIQFSPKFKAKSENLKVLVRMIEEAVAKGAQLIVLPELAATGYSFMSYEDAEPLSEIIGPGAQSFAIMSGLSRQHNVAIAWGLIEKDEGTGKLYNSQVLRVPHAYESYRKINRWGNDFLWASEGRSNPTILNVSFNGTDQRKVGLLICRDIRDRKDGNWESFYEPGDADIVAMSSNWGNGGFPAISWVEFAKDNNVSLVISNRYGKEIPNDFGEGGVCVISPKGDVAVDGLVWNADCIVYSEV